VDIKADLKRLRPYLNDSTSRRTSFTSRSAKGIENPLDEVRKRLASLEPLSRTPASTVLETTDIPDTAVSESGISASIDLSAVTRSGRKSRHESKAAPAIGSSQATAVGTTTIHDELVSRQSTPVAGSSTRGGTAPYSSSYEGQDPGVRAFLEQVDLDNYREPLLDLGPKIVASQRKRSRNKANSTQGGVTMIAHLTHHTGEVTGIVTSPDQTFFATCSEDSQLLIWDSAKLERSVSAKPRLVYTMDSAISSMCRIENTHCLAVTGEDGQLHIVRVHVSLGTSVKYGKVECIRTWHTGEKDGHVVSVSHMSGELGVVPC
jgi:phosphoinositide-3-kinase regulatory subunit 4